MNKQIQQAKYTNNALNSKEKMLLLMQTMLDEGHIEPYELGRYVGKIENPCHPEYVRQELETWYKNLGIESLINGKFTLSTCPFSAQEIEEAQANNETILCVPKGIKREILGKLFRIDSWALHDKLVTRATEKEDFWFRASKNPTPHDLWTTGSEIRQRQREAGQVLFSLERYLVFIARLTFLTSQTPDYQYWIWLPHRAYDRSGMLIAGFDRFYNFNVHGWMPQFSASFLGARVGIPPASA